MHRLVEMVVMDSVVHTFDSNNDSKTVMRFGTVISGPLYSFEIHRESESLVCKLLFSIKPSSLFLTANIDNVFKVGNPVS